MAFPPRSGLYDPRFEHDACGVGFVANVAGIASHDVVRRGLDVLLNLVHRGASGCDPLTGDGAGILFQVPHAFLARECEAVGFELPRPGSYGVGNVFLPRNKSSLEHMKSILEDKILGTGQRLLGWREVPVDQSVLGPVARASAPLVLQVFIGSTAAEPGAFERKLFVIRKWSERAVRESGLRDADTFYIPSLSSRTLVYKGLLLAEQLAPFYPDLADRGLVSALAMVHQRFSTNTFPTWHLAQPFRVLSHNGEINTIRGNSAWMSAREQLFDGEIFGEDIRHILPTITPGGSDSAALDNVAEMLLHAGRDLAHVMLMLVPEAWQNDFLMPEFKRDFYEYHSCLMEPWDGPAALTFTDGVRVGGLLDRNGLRPARWSLTRGGLVVLGSETGVLDLAPQEIERTGRLEPGRMFLVDTDAGRIVEDEELKEHICRRKPYGKWLRHSRLRLSEIEDAPPAGSRPGELPLSTQQKMFGYTEEDLRLLLIPMASSGAEPVGSMGTDTPLAVLSNRPQLLFNYFKQHFAQVTNPPIDPIREERVMSLRSYIGGEGNVLFELPDQAQMLELPHPLLTNSELAKLRTTHHQQLRVPPTLSSLYPVAEGGRGLKRALDELCRQASLAVLNKHSLLVLSDRGGTEHMAPVPSLLSLGAVHHHLIRNGTRVKVGLIVETGDAREVHHFALLTGYGASAVNPYLALDTVKDLARQGRLDAGSDPHAALDNYTRAVNKGLLKVMSKMGISTLQSYHGAQIFEAIGLTPDVVDRYFAGTASRISGIDLDLIAEECRRRHELGFPKKVAGAVGLERRGEYQYRSQGERHLWGPQSVSALQRAVRQEDVQSYREYARLINEQADAPITLRSLWHFTNAQASVPLDEVEPASSIVKRFATGAMSFGSISREAHENLAIAMNRIGGRSNTGEGGERSERYLPDANGDFRRSAIKQVASARFGVTAHYLVNADELQIKIAQGAKPGEGGQLPGHKVDALIAETRHSTAGVTLISPPPHHDIYSIEDLAQLIFDLKLVNPKARISVKLVAEAGVGTIAAGVAKAHADAILIAGHDGGTGAAPLSSIKHAGVPWELGLAEAHQVLVKNDLRSRVALQADGQMRTGRDVVIATLLGAEEFGFATAPLVASGCIMMRKCHLNTCPVGVATQDPVLRKKFQGQPEHVVRFMFYVAEEARELMAALGFRRLTEMVGRVERLRVRQDLNHWKASHLDFTDVLTPAEARSGVGVYKQQEQDHGLEVAFDARWIAQALPAIEEGSAVSLELSIRNLDRAVGAGVAGAITRRHGERGLPDGTLAAHFNGSAGQSFGAFLVNGMHFHLAGDANDYVGKGMSGGTLSVRCPDGSNLVSDKNVIVGNTALYGATGGSAYIAGIAGERFAVRNSGATAVVEGLGDHGCEYMTGGVVVVLGRTGRNFAAGMSGGMAFVLDATAGFEQRCNLDMVDLEPLTSEDAKLLRGLIERHAELTRSRKAQRLLEDWGRARRSFIKVMPRDYKNALAAARKRLRSTTSDKHGSQASPGERPEGIAEGAE